MFHVEDVIFDKEIKELNMEALTGVIGAMESEVLLLREKMHIWKAETISGMTFWEGSLNDHPLVLVKCGVGKVAAAICAQTLILRYGVERVINIGVAGALDKHLSVGDIVVSTEAVQHDFDMGGLAGSEKMELPAMGVLKADGELRQKAVTAAKKVAPKVQVLEGRVCSGDQFIAGKAKKQAIIDKHDGSCCEMEGAAIAQVCDMNGIPFVVIRAISDKADESGELTFSALSDAVARRSAAIVSDMLEDFHR